MKIALFFILVSLRVEAAEGDLMKAFQREYAFLAAQKESLLQDQKISEKKYSEVLRKLENDVITLEKKVVLAGVANDKNFEKLQNLEQQKKEQKNRDGSLSSNLKRALKTLGEAEQSLNFESITKVDIPMPSLVKVSDFDTIRKKSLEVLKQSSKVSEVEAAYKNLEGQVVQGPVVRYGRIAAHAISGTQRSVLGPDGAGLLSILEVIPGNQKILPVYLYESLLDKAVLKKKASIFDIIADAMPLVILGSMFALVGGLFLMFARE